MIKRNHRSRAALAALGLAAILVLAACGQSTPADSGSAATTSAGTPTTTTPPYPTADLDWIVPYSAGGGFDTYSRGFGSVMQTYLPDGLRIQVRNVTPFAEGLSEVYSSDDLNTLGIMPMPAAAAAQIRFPDIAVWDTANYTILGSISENPYVVYVAGDSSIQTWEDLVSGSNLRAITVERGSGSSLAAAITIRSMDLDADLTFGADGSVGSATALLRGDVDFIVYGVTDLVGFVESGDIRPVLFLGSEDQRPDGFDWLQGIPTAGAAGFPDLEGAVTELRIVVAPPDLPEYAVQYLEEVVWETLNSPELIAWSEQAGRPLVPRNAQDARSAVEAQIQTVEQLVPELVEEGLI